MELGEGVMRRNAESKVHLGAVYLVMDAEAGKQKIHVIVGFSGDKLTSVAVRVNSEVNKWTPPAERGYHVPVEKKKNAFLAHNSYLNCSKLLPPVGVEDLANYFYSHPGKYLGKLDEVDLGVAKMTIANAHTIENATKELYDLNFKQ